MRLPGFRQIRVDDYDLMKVQDSVRDGFQGVETRIRSMQEMAEPWQPWSPVVSGGGSLTFTSPSVVFAEYSRLYDTLRFSVRVEGTLGGTGNISIEISGLPFEPGFFDGSPDGTNFVGSAAVFGAVAGIGVFLIAKGSGSTLFVRRSDATNWPTSGSQIIVAQGEYRLKEEDYFRR